MPSVVVETWTLGRTRRLLDRWSVPVEPGPADDDGRALTLRDHIARSCHREPRRSSSSAQASAPSRLRETMNTRPPFRQNTRAMPLPMPLLAPVAITDRPAIDVSMNSPAGYSGVLRSRSRSSRRHTALQNLARSGLVPAFRKPCVSKDFCRNHKWGESYWNRQYVSTVLLFA